MEEAQQDWLVVYTVLLGLSAVATLAALLLAFKQINLATSAVQTITYALCCSYFVLATTRWVFYLCVLGDWRGIQHTLNRDDAVQFAAVRTMYASQNHDLTARWVIITLTVVGDIAKLSTALWVMTISYEMMRLITKSMDRGRDREREIMRQYNIRTYAFATVVSVGVASSAMLSPNHEIIMRRIAGILQTTSLWASILYPVYCTIAISRYKRTHAIINPDSLRLHERIKRVVGVYCTLTFPACMLSLLLRTEQVDVPAGWVGICQSTYYISGAGMAFAIGASVTCCYRALRPVMPPSVYEHLLETGYFPDQVEFDPNVVVEPPMNRPVFVCTDIEDSTLLWASDAQAMTEAQSRHDDLLRFKLLKFHGYEITTAGDAFQLAFHRISDAIGWCLRVQEKLLLVDWPANLLELHSACEKRDASGQLLFRGLRVRMAIHDGDDNLVCSKHPTTGKMTYLGVSEIVAREMADLGRGGDILISETALTAYELEKRNDMAHQVHNTFYHEMLPRRFVREELMVSLPVHRIISNVIGDRFRGEQGTRSELVTAQLTLLRGGR